MTEESKDPPGSEGRTPPPAAGTEPGRPDRSLPALLAALAVLVVIALAVVFTRGDPPPLDTSTPAGVVQQYTAAVIDGDETAAAAYLTPAARKRCSEGEPGGRDKIRVTLVRTTERANSADVKVLISFIEGGGPFGSSEHQVEEVFDLSRTGDKWLIERAPWQLTVCPGPAVKP